MGKPINIKTPNYRCTMADIRAVVRAVNYWYVDSDGQPADYAYADIEKEIEIDGYGCVECGEQFENFKEAKEHLKK